MKATAAMGIFVLIAFALALPANAHSVSVNGTGQKGFPGLADSATDPVTLTILIENVFEEFDEEEVGVGTYKISEFEGYSCADAGENRHECTVNVGWVGSGCRSYTASYKGASGTGTVCLDSKAPEVRGFAIVSQKRTFSPQEEVEIRVTAVDHAESSLCAGVAKARIFQEGGGAGHTISVEEKGECSFYFAGPVLLSSIVSTESGSVEICAEAEDHFGHKSAKKCTKISVDGVPPVVQANSFALYTRDRSRKLGEYYQANRLYDAVPFINISENSASVSARANLTIKSGETVIREARNLNLQCTKAGETFSCFFSVFSFSLPSTGDSFTLEYTVLAKDAAGNTGEGRGHITLKIDNYRPKPTQIIAASSLDPKTLGKQPTITVKLDEQGCGLHDRQVFITSAAFGRRRANECVHEGGSQWVCSFSGFTISDSHHGSTADVSVTQDSRDECANRVEGDRKESFFIDTKKPVINSINVTNNAKELFIKEGDSLIVKLDISDDSDMVYVSGNFSRVTEGQDVVKGTCKKQGNFTCTITVSGLKASSEDVTIIIQDKANNTERATIRINIYGRDEREDTDFWIAANEKVSPEMIDRSLAAKTTMRVFANFDLRARNERQALVSIKNLKCQGEEVKIQKTDLLFTPDRSPGTKSIAIYMELSRQNIQVNSDVVTCTMDLVTFTGDAITTSPEKETVELELTFYDGFLGVSGDNAYDKIKRRGEFLKDADWAAGLLKGYNVFEKACAGFTTLTIGVETFNILALADIELISGVMLTGIAEGLNELVGEAAIKFGREVCNIISCKNLYPIPGFDEQGLRGIIWGQETCREATKDIEWLNFLEEEDNIKDNTITVRCPDPKNNLISAALYGCWPYVITGVQKMMVIEAMTLDCYLNSIESGLPIYHCDNMHSQLYCEWILGDFFEIIPQAQAIGKIRDMALNVLEDPISMAVTLFSLISPKLPETSIGTLTIMVTEFTDSIFKATRLFEEIKSYAVGETDMDYVTKVTTRYEKTIDSR